MDLLLLGSESRKTHIRPRQNLTKDKYDMEDIDEFFEEDDDTIHVPKESHYKETTIPKDNFNNVARKINFTDAEAASFNLSPISLSSRNAAKKRDKKSPLRSPLQEHDKQNEEKQLFLDEQEDINDYNNDNFDNNNDFNDDADMILSPVYLSPIRKGKKLNKNTVTKSNESNISKSKPSKNKSTSALTKSMALGSSSKKGKQVIDRENADDESPSIDESSELMSPPSTNKRKTVKRNIEQKESIIKPSPLPSPPPDGLRRSKRTRIAPLAFWRNERIVYARANEYDENPDTTLIDDIRKIPLQEIKEVVHIPEVNGPISFSNKKRSRSRSRNAFSKIKPKKEVYDYESDPEINGSEWFNKKSLTIDVFEDPEKEIKVKRTVAWAPNGGDFEKAPSNKDDPSSVENFKVATLFNHNRDFTASGLLEFPFEGFKSLRNSGECIFSFHVVKGLIEVTINNDKFVVTRGCSFEVPSANIYGFKNIGQGSARLFFVQSRIPHSDELEEEEE